MNRHHVRHLADVMCCIQFPITNVQLPVNVRMANGSVVNHTLSTGHSVIHWSPAFDRLRPGRLAIGNGKFCSLPPGGAGQDKLEIRRHDGERVDLTDIDRAGYCDHQIF